VLPGRAVWDSFGAGTPTDNGRAIMGDQMKRLVTTFAVLAGLALVHTGGSAGLFGYSDKLITDS